ncbi:MAG: cobyrinic acid a,c-diamide synthase [Tardiphaga sp.]|jgi:cobyrinic acid a,c-diamide synthase|uniref:cobyrinate a,c-diamide synthase n=1 Tax=Tardiphaga sp. TaxID=1926292 RepID=UPI0026158DA6|nr:cobyrinate a,c-diamide synthase [Tardiphaga sp.]MDB5504949.1 cobyrinic acid a,c-diamide synthase [Tardiphaga sp.]
MTTGLLISAARSGAGKTTVTLGILAALARRGLRVRAAKAGPDYIDPAFHAAATGSASVNLDSWTMPGALLDSLMAEAADGADLVVVEGVMGLFDGVPGVAGREGSSANIAAQFRLPVLLVLDVTAQSQSAAAMVRGFASHDPDVRVAGVILNRVGSDRHRRLITDAIEKLGMPVVGSIPRNETFGLPERHLGLVQAGEHGDLAARFTVLAEMAEKHLDLDAIVALATPIDSARNTIAAALAPPGQRIALASDGAFSFVYPHLLDDWRRAGSEIVRFSPLADEGPPEHCDVCWLPGGYPELHAATLANATRFREDLIRFARTRPVHGECGGYMVLGAAIEDADGVMHAMTGLLCHVTSFQKRRLHLGYREARLLADSPIGAAGTRVRGHEFHYASLISQGTDDPLVDLSNAQGEPVGERGGRRGHVTGSFFHAIAAVEG